MGLFAGYGQFKQDNIIKMKSQKINNMKHLILIFCFFALRSIGICQDFQGTVTYIAEYKNPDPEVLTDSLFNKRFEKKRILVYYFKDNKYKTVEKENNRVNLYEPKKNRIYDYIEGNDSVIWVEAMSQMNEIVEIIKSDETEKINSIDCNCVILKTRIGELKYYFSNKYNFDPIKFNGHQFGIWEDYLKELGVIPLKCIVKSPFLYETLIAIDIKEEELSDKIFELPKFKVKVKYTN